MIFGPFSGAMSDAQFRWAILQMTGRASLAPTSFPPLRPAVESRPAVAGAALTRPPSGATLSRQAGEGLAKAGGRLFGVG